MFVNNFSIEGVCRNVGKPLDEENSFAAKAIKKHFLSAYKAYSHLAEERLFEITPTLIYSWGYEGIKPYMDFGILKLRLTEGSKNNEKRMWNSKVRSCLLHLFRK